MTHGPEYAVKQDIKELLTSIGAWFFMPVPTGYGRRGISDFVGIYKGRGFLIEAKAEFGQLTAWQEKELYKARDAGGIAICATAPNHLAQVREALGLTGLCPHNAEWDDCPDCRH